MTCPDLKSPVPCGDGSCHPDYISCLKVTILELYTLTIIYFILIIYNSIMFLISL